jgi:hypothetical protein
MNAIARAVMVSVVACLAAACETRPSIAEDDFVHAVVDAQCADLLPCCEKSGFAQVRADCMKGFAKSWSSMAKAARAAHASYDGVAAAECVDQTRRWVRECESIKFDDPELRAQPCAEIYRGGRTRLGAKCVSDWECGGTSEEPRACVAEIDHETHAIVRHCHSVVTVGRGDTAATDAATHTVHRCAPGLLADEHNVCRTRYVFGEPCILIGYGDTCETGLVCDASNTRRCVTALPIGAKCTALDQCEGYACQMGRCAVPSGAYCE